ncbi:hypothetical protein, partial [Capnocytophaga sp.]|uniref:hypothetical protein n=1 Tax=Capnocytophaga sp. TaxID=44737 RepID=UPI0026DB8D73
REHKMNVRERNINTRECKMNVQKHKTNTKKQEIEPFFVIKINFKGKKNSKTHETAIKIPL